MNRQYKKLLAVLLVVALSAMMVFAGCGKTTSAEPEKSAETKEPEEKAGEKTEVAEAGDDDVFKVAVTYQANTEYGNYAQFIMENMEDEINSTGGINGKNVVFELLDYGTDQQGYITLVQKIVSDDSYDAMIGSLYGDFCIAASDLVKDAKLPSFNLSCNNKQLEMNDYYFITRASIDGSLGAWQSMAAESDFSNPYIISQNTETSVPTCEGLRDALLAEGKTVAGLEYYNSANVTDYTPLVAKITNSGCDGVIINSTGGTDGQSLLQLLYDYQFEGPKCVVSTMMDYTVLDAIGAEALNGAYGLSEYSIDLDTEGNKTYLQHMEDWEFDGTNNWIYAVYYDSALVLTEAAKNIDGEINRENLYSALSTVSNIAGAMSVYNYHADQCFSEYVYKATWIDGKVVLSDTIEVVHF